MDDRTVGLVLRALRRRRGWRQSDLAARAGCSQALVSSVERGHLGAVTVETLRGLFAAVDARIVVEPRWRGAELERLLDQDHAILVAATAARFERAGWTPMVEVTYAVGVERGSIDVMGVHESRRAVVVAEIKSDIPSAEATGRKLDEKRRLAPAVVRARLAWTPVTVGALLVLPHATRLRDLLAGPAAILARMFPVDAIRVRRWLADPVGPLAATWFVRNISGRNRARIRSPRGTRPGRGDAGSRAAVNVEPQPERPRVTILR